MASYVHDSTSVIAYLRNEPGSDKIVSIIEDENNLSYVHNGNLIEVFSKMLAQGFTSDPQVLINDLELIDMRRVEDLGDSFWIPAARLRFTARAISQKISYLDCFALTLAVQLGATLVTCDPDFRPIEQQGLCKAFFFR